MTRLLRLTAVLALTAPLLASAGCKQGVGDRCQVQSDCADNLICVLPAGATPQAGGSCQNPATATGDMAATTSTDMAMTTTPPADMTSTSTSD